jgi:hypothetical protein
MLDTPSNASGGIRLQSFTIAYEYPVVFTRGAFNPANRRAGGEWRIHRHVPLFLADLGEIGSTRADLEAVLAALRRKSHSSHLEVETYTWDVLADNLRTGSKAADIAREMSFCVKELGG